MGDIFCRGLQECIRLAKKRVLTAQRGRIVKRGRKKRSHALEGADVPASKKDLCLAMTTPAEELHWQGLELTFDSPFVGFDHCFWLLPARCHQAFDDLQTPLGERFLSNSSFLPARGRRILRRCCHATLSAAVSDLVIGPTDIFLECGR